jgi:hydrogenase maturation protease
MTDEIGHETVDVTSHRRGPTLILGLGNAILCDDGVGIKAARYIVELGPNPDIVVKEAELAGFALIDMLEGFDRAVVIDAVRTRSGNPGDIVVFDSSSLEPSLHLVAGHQIDLPTALEMGRRLGRPVPSTVRIVGVQIENDTTFSESCTPGVEAAIPEAARTALRIAADMG